MNPRSVTEGFVDSASTYDVVLALSRQTPHGSYRTEWETALQVTALFIGTERIRLPQTPNPERAPSGPFGVIVAGFEGRVGRSSIAGPDNADAIRSTKQWIRRNKARIADRIEIALGTRPSQPGDESRQWMDAHLGLEWSELPARRGTLFDPVFSHQLADIVGVSTRDLTRLSAYCKDEPFICNLAKERPDNEAFNVLSRAYLGSVFIRGQYYEQAARLAKVQLHSHPVRRPFQIRGVSGAAQPIEISNTEQYLANIVLAGAFAEKNPVNRAHLWVKNVCALREARVRVNLSARPRDEMARDDAIDIARRFGVEVHSRRLEVGLDAGVALGTAAFSLLALTPWQAFELGVATYAVTRGRNVGSLLAKQLGDAKIRLGVLSTQGPGRIGPSGKPAR